jgi:NAD(P)-dependent dehydrogenase (short-subunit alcohol dehydrogenase family)
MFHTNARAPFFLMQVFVKHRLAEGGGGAIVNILSQCAHCGQSYLSAYSASKGALATLTKNVANGYRYLLSADASVMTGALVDYDQNVPGAYPE